MGNAEASVPGGRVSRRVRIDGRTVFAILERDITTNQVWVCGLYGGLQACPAAEAISALFALGKRIDSPC